MMQTFQVSGMTCAHCERAVTEAILQVDPQAQVSIDRVAGRVEVQSLQDHQALAQAIVAEGYRVA